LRSAFAAEGAAAERIVLRGRQASLEDHFGDYREIDIALDTFPYNGTTTTCEALWMGVPVVTLEGGAHVGRVGASLLKGLGLEELVAQDTEDFVERAAALAADAGRRAALHATLRERMTAAPLMDADGFVRALEEAYRRMWRDWCVSSKRDCGS
jgi:predicted O-linked N-acetylglucosamine transferase (SPINDLY family)